MRRYLIMACIAMLGLTGCQTFTTDNNSTANAPTTVNQTASNLRLFLADKQAHPGWDKVDIRPSGVLYVDTNNAILDRSDLDWIQSAHDNHNNGILVLFLKTEAQQRLLQQTQLNKNKYLALVVGQTMLAAPQFKQAINQNQLAFEVGSIRNAELAAKTVAGVE